MGSLGLLNYDRGRDQNPRFGAVRRSSTRPILESLNDENLLAAEETAQRLLRCIHPTFESEERRKEIVEYVQRLIRSNLHCEVFPYGSVPLKTYLPEGDIDFTAFRGPVSDESIAYDTFSLVLREEKNKNAEYRVRDTQFINAEVKLVKCIVEEFVVDISFNQLGGLSTLCFLEQVDCLVGRNHLFKRSVILVKAWCYYESRILGSHHGLISTYALEILVLYIFHQFNTSLHGPLAVLHRFLSFYSQFDWENYGISLKGPICVSSLPNIVVRKPESCCTAPIFGEGFLDNCREMFSVASKMPEGRNLKPFQKKYLNIIDPLNESNNLGRSVHKGSFYRIRTAFRYGACKLSHVLSLPREKVGDEISRFFMNTLTMHGRKHRGTDHPSAKYSPRPAEFFRQNAFLSKPSIIRVDDGEKQMEGNINLKSRSTDSGSCALKSNPFEKFSLDFRELEVRSTGESKLMNPLADLKGDYDSHTNGLRCGQQCHSNPSPAASGVHRCSSHPRSPKNVRLLDRGMSSYPGSIVSSTRSAVAANFTLNSIESQRARGTGTYLPNVNGFYRDKYYQMRSRGKPAGKFCRRDFLADEPSSSYSCSSNGIPRVPPPVRRTGLVSLENGRGSCKIQFGSIGSFSGSSDASGSDSSSLGSDAAVLSHKKRGGGEVIEIKNEDEFPPLCR